jgi:predicted transcriptional regulator
MRKLKSAGPVSTLQVLDVFSDRISFDIMNAISEKVTTSDNIRDLLGLTRKQFYTRHSSLLKRGLIKRKDTELTLTSFGQLIYQALLKIAIAYRHSLELRAIDAVKSTAGIPYDELKNLIDKLILDAGMKKLVYEQ